MEERYDIDVEQDSLKGIIGMVIVKFSKYIGEHNIDRNNNNNPVIIKYKEAIMLERYIYSYKTYEELDEVEQKLNELRSFLHGL